MNEEPNIEEKKQFIIIKIQSLIKPELTIIQEALESPSF